MATALLNAGRAGDAVTCLEKARLPPGEDADMVQAILGLALQLDARASEATRVLRAVAMTAPEPQDNSMPASEGTLLARRLLGETPADDAPR